MLDKALDTIATADSFYFQLYPLSLAIANPDCDLPSPGTTYRFTVLKGTPITKKVSRSSTKPNYPSKPSSSRSTVAM